MLDLLARDEFAALFGPGSRAEQAICGTVGGRPVVGQIDRLLITADEVMVVDLKSNRRPPASMAEVPVGYLAQLATYRSLLRALYPDAAHPLGPPLDRGAEAGLDPGRAPRSPQP